MPTLGFLLAVKIERTWSAHKHSFSFPLHHKVNRSLLIFVLAVLAFSDYYGRNYSATLKLIECGSNEESILRDRIGRSTSDGNPARLRHRANARWTLEASHHTVWPQICPETNFWSRPTKEFPALLHHHSSSWTFPSSCPSSPYLGRSIFFLNVMKCIFRNTKKSQIFLNISFG